ncbi:MAG: chorismate mutase [Actinomycetota bacterium]|nr:chorismate mutase [Actinomycetota bacterium]
MADPSADPTIARFREEISDNDRVIVEAINRRLQLVARLKAYKESRGLDFVDSAREEWIFRFLSRANRGPLSDEGLREVYTEILDLTKREVARAAPRGQAAAPAPPGSTGAA